MERLENISHLRQLLFHDNDLIELMQNKGFVYVMAKVKERFCNINDFDEKVITKGLEIRFSSMNHLVNKAGKLSDGWRNLLMRRIYWALFGEEMDSEDTRYARRAGLGSSISDYDISQQDKIIEIMCNLEKKVLCNELKNYDQACQYVDALISEIFNK